MPLHDHFHPPLSQLRPWESFHSTWAGSLADLLNRGVLPPGYIALEQINAGAPIEIDVSTYKELLSLPVSFQGGERSITSA